jgi:hypothetical protein
MSKYDFQLSMVDGPACNPGRARQWTKIREITEALESAGFVSLDEQAEAIGLSRSTTWSILSGLHKNSGLTTNTIGRILGTKKLPAPVRKKLLEYVEEKAQGLYGDSPMRIEQFKERLAAIGISALPPRRGNADFFIGSDDGLKPQISKSDGN